MEEHRNGAGERFFPVAEGSGVLFDLIRALLVAPVGDADSLAGTLESYLGRWYVASGARRRPQPVPHVTA